MSVPRGTRGWILAAVAAIAIAAIAYAGQPPQDSPDHSSSSDAANGTSAILLFARALGHPAAQLSGSFAPPAGDGVMFVFTPTAPYSSGEAGQTLAWVRAGGVLVYASEQGDTELDRAFGVTRTNGLAFVDAEVGNPTVTGVSQAAGGGTVEPLDPSAQQVPFLRTSAGQVTGYRQRIGSGEVVVLADPLVLCNGYLDKKDNGRLLADLLGLAAPDAQVVFDEYHHGVVLSDLGPQAWVLTPWGAALLWLLVAVFVGLLLRGRRFGPLLAPPPETARSDVEWATAVGRLLHRSSAREVTLGLLANAAEREVAGRTGLPLQPRERFWNALWVRSPELASALAEAETSLRRDAATEQGALHAARRLHRLAYPLPERQADGRPS